MRDTVYVVVFDGFADWQAALALCEVRRPGDWSVRTLGLETDPVVSMGGLSVLPDTSLGALDFTRAAMVVVPGGHLWLRESAGTLVDLLRQAHAAGATVAGIDTGVLPLARAGLLDQVRHTGNWAGQLDDVPGYAGTEQYDAGVLAANDGGVITASHLGSIEFAREVIRTLDLYDAGDREDWYRLFKHARLPAWCTGEAAPAKVAA